MEISEAKKELKSYRQIERKIDAHAKWINERIENICKVTTTLSPEPKIKRKQNDVMAETLSDILDTEAESEIVIRELEVKKKIIYNKIMKLEQPYQDILFSIYIAGRTTEDTAEVIGYSVQHTWKLKKEAIINYANNN